MRDINWVIRQLQLIWCKIKNLETANIPPHNELEGLQGGQPNQYYHLTEAQYNCVIENCTDEGIGTWGTQQGIFTNQFTQQFT